VLEALLGYGGLLDPIQFERAQARGPVFVTVPADVNRMTHRRRLEGVGSQVVGVDGTGKSLVRAADFAPFNPAGDQVGKDLGRGGGEGQGGRWMDRRQKEAHFGGQGLGQFVDGALGERGEAAAVLAEQPGTEE
jgi:hypothetical protein